MAIRQKKMISFLAQRGLSDKEIYQEMGRVYGKHIVVQALGSDGSIESDYSSLKNMFKAQAMLGFGYFIFRLLKRKP
jgi:hypothetical protein